MFVITFGSFVCATGLLFANVIASPGAPGYGVGSGGSKSSSSGGTYGIAVVPLSLPSANYGSNPGINFGGDSYEEDDVPGVGFVGSQPHSAPTYPARPKGPSSGYGGGGGGSSSFLNSGSFGSPAASGYDADGDVPTGFGGHFSGSGSPNFGEIHAIRGYGNGAAAATVPQLTFGGPQSGFRPGAHGQSGTYNEPQGGQQFIQFGKIQGKGKNNNKGSGGYGIGQGPSSGTFPGARENAFGPDFSTSHSSSLSLDQNGPVFQPQPSTNGLKGAHYSNFPKFNPVDNPSYEAGPYSAQGLTGATYGGSPSVGLPTPFGAGCCGGKKNKISSVPYAVEPVVPSTYAAYVPAPAPKRPKLGY